MAVRTKDGFLRIDGRADEDDMKRRRLRFSVRWLFVCVTIVAVYFGLWEATKNWGIIDLKNYYTQRIRFLSDEDIVVKAPLIIEAGDWYAAVDVDNPLDGSTSGLTWHRQYHFWFFGYISTLHTE